jgi:DNA-binding NarL/FixJ family response regulator
MDITMPGISGIECVKALSTSLPNLPVVMFTGRRDRDAIILSLRAGARGYLIKPVAPAQLLSAVSSAIAGLPAFSADAVHALSRRPRTTRVNPLGALTPRQMDVLALAAQHLTNKEIAGRLRIGVGSVHTHLVRSSKRLRVHSRTAAARKFLSLG